MAKLTFRLIAVMHSRYKSAGADARAGSDAVAGSDALAGSAAVAIYRWFY